MIYFLFEIGEFRAWQRETNAIIQKQDGSQFTQAEQKELKETIDLYFDDYNNTVFLHEASTDWEEKKQTSMVLMRS